MDQIFNASQQDLVRMCQACGIDPNPRNLIRDWLAAERRKEVAEAATSSLPGGLMPGLTLQEHRAVEILRGCFSRCGTKSDDEPLRNSLHHGYVALFYEPGQIIPAGQSSNASSMHSSGGGTSQGGFGEAPGQHGNKRPRIENGGRIEGSGQIGVKKRASGVKKQRKSNGGASEIDGKSEIKRRRGKGMMKGTSTERITGNDVGGNAFIEKTFADTAGYLDNYGGCSRNNAGNNASDNKHQF